MTVTRDRRISVPDIISKYETVYIQKYLAAISEREKHTISTVEELEQKFPKYIQGLKVQRERFYSAENLKAFASKYLLTDDYFNDLVNDIYYGIYDVLGKIYTDGFERLNDVMSQVVRIDLQHNLLSKYDLVHPQDRQGICHQLANERSDIVWANLN